MALEQLIDGIIVILKKEEIPVPEGMDYDSDHPAMENLWNNVEVLAISYVDSGSDEKKKKLLTDEYPTISKNLRNAIKNKDYDNIIDGIFNLGKLYQDFMLDPESTNPSHTQFAKDYSKHPR